MAYKFVSEEFIEEQIREENLDHEARIEVYAVLLEQIQEGHLLFRDEETDKYSLVEKDESIPPHMQYICQSSAVH